MKLLNKKKLPKGTLLYRCSIYKDPTNFTLKDDNIMMNCKMWKSMDSIRNK